MSLTRDETIELFKAALPPVAFAFLKNIDILAQDAITEPSPEQVAFCWNEALIECEVGMKMTDHLANTLPEQYGDGNHDWYDANNIDWLLRDAGLLK